MLTFEGFRGKTPFESWGYFRTVALEKYQINPGKGEFTCLDEEKNKEKGNFHGIAKIFPGS